MGGVPQAGVDVAGGTGGVHRPLGHEGGGPAVLTGDLLHAVLEHEVAVGDLEGGAVGDVDLVLADAGLALRELDRDAGLGHLVADAGDDVLLARRLQELVVLDRRGVGGEVLPALLAGLGERVEEQVELELGGALDHVPPLGGPLDLASQDLTGGDLDRVAVHGQEVAQDQHAAGQPGDGPDGLRVDDGVQVAVAGLPVGELVARAAGPCRRRRPAGSRRPRCRGRRRARGRTPRSPACPPVDPGGRGRPPRRCGRPRFGSGAGGSRASASLHSGPRRTESSTAGPRPARRPGAVHRRRPAAGRRRDRGMGYWHPCPDRPPAR